MGDGTIIMTVKSSDNETEAGRMAYLLNWVAGELPSNFTVPQAPLCPSTEVDSTGTLRSKLFLYWDDGESNTQEPFQFAFLVTAIDKAGNRSEHSDTVWVQDSGK